MTIRDNDPDRTLDEGRPLDDNRLVEPDRVADEGRPVDEGRSLDENRPLDQDRPLDEGRPLEDGGRLDAGRGWQDEPTLADDDDRTPDAATADPTNDAVDATPAPGATANDPLVPDDASVDFKARWTVIQQGFVDDPRAAVTDADKLVSDVLERLSATFDEQHQGLEGQWADGEPSTEDLRSALQRYRAFFERLLTL